MNTTLAFPPFFDAGPLIGVPSSAPRRLMHRTTLNIDFVNAVSLPTVPDWKKLLDANAARLAALKAGWDGYGSLPISKPVLFAAIDIVDRALSCVPNAIAPYLVPAGDGSVQVEWHEHHAELELELSADGQMCILFRDHLTGAELVGEGPKALNLFLRWAPWVASQSGDVDDVPHSQSVANFDVAA